MPTNQCSLERFAAFLFALANVFSYVTSQSVSIASNGLSVTVNGIPYFVSPYVAGNITVNVTALSESASVNGFYPITIVQETVTSSELPGLVKNFTAADDVFQTAFTQGMPNDSLPPSGCSPAIEPQAIESLN